jgi:cytochrome b
MSDNEVIRRGDVLRCCYGSARRSEARIAALPADPRVEKLVEALRNEVKRSRRHLAASTLEALAAWETDHE